LVVLSKLSVISDSIGNDEIAMEYLHRAEDMVSGWKNEPSDLEKELFKVVYYHLTRIHRRDKDMKRVYEIIQKSIALETDPYALAILKFDLGMTFMADGVFDGARKWLQEALVYFSQHDRYIEAQCLTYLGEIENKENNYEGAKIIWKKALEIAQELKNSEFEKVLLERLEGVQ
jgi:tetratricopeptide (TPR) repeat protein